MKKLTIGMAVYEDFDGLYFTIQSLRLHHKIDWSEVEFLIIDNCPTGKHAPTIKEFITQYLQNGRYIGSEQIKGTAIRDLIFRESNAEYVLCLDSHVLLAEGALESLLHYYSENPSTTDLIQGPLIQDGFSSLATHLTPTWSAGFFGVWVQLPPQEFQNNQPFEIRANGLGLFSCRKAAWPGFNRHFKGFGGEEFYIQDKFKQRGDKTLCLPQLKWLHRFFRPLGVPYVNKWEDRIRNYLIGRDELGQNHDDVLEHFEKLVGTKLLAKVVEELNAENILRHPIEFKGPVRLKNILVLGNLGSGVNSMATNLGTYFGMKTVNIESSLWSSDTSEKPQKEFFGESLLSIKKELHGYSNWILATDSFEIADSLIDTIDLVVFLDFSLPRRQHRLEAESYHKWGNEIYRGGSRFSHVEELKKQAGRSVNRSKKLLDTTTIVIKGELQQNDETLFYLAVDELKKNYLTPKDP